MFCKVVKSVYICISKQVIRNLSARVMNVGATFNNEAAGRLIKKATKICKVEKYTYLCYRKTIKYN